jgi:hypothetical protein
MREKYAVYVGLGIFLFILGFFKFSPTGTVTFPEVQAQRMGATREHIITIKGELGNNRVITQIVPKEVSVGTGDSVTWINESPIEVRIKFGKGTECKKVSLKALGWRLEPDKCFETEDTLKPGLSSTIQFKEIGIFHYEIEYVDRNRWEKGIVRVQTERR